MKKTILMMILALLALVPAAAFAQPTQTVRFQLNWVDNSNNEQGFRLERCTGSGCTSFTQVGGDLAGNTISYQDTIFNDTGNTWVCYRVKAFNSVGESAPSNATCAQTPAIDIPPTAPSGLTIQPAPPQQTSLMLRWRDNSGDETGFEVERDGKIITTTAKNTESFHNTGLRRNQRYSYRVRSVGLYQKSPWTPAVVGRPH